MADYGRCTDCGGTIQERRTTQEYRIGDRIVMVFDAVPTGVCTSCGGKSFLQSVLARMESMALKREALKGVHFVPVVVFREAPAASSSSTW